MGATISFYLGAGQSQRANAAASRGFLLSALHGLVLTAAASLLTPFFLAMFTTEPVSYTHLVIPVDFESSSPALQAYIVKDYCQEPSNFRSQGALDIFLSQNNVPGLWGVDTRALTRIVREYGVMNAALVQGALPQDLTALLAKIKSYRITGAVEAVSYTHLNLAA